MRKFIFGLAGAGALVLYAGAASATTTTDLTYNGFANGSKTLKVHAVVGAASRTVQVKAGGFSMTGTNPVEGFVAWCLDILQNIVPGPATYAYGDFLGGEQLSRVQKVFEVGYGTALDSALKSAAFQVALWDAAYDDDWNAGGVGSGAGGSFRISQNASVLGAANGLLDAAKGHSGAPQYMLTSLKSPVAQDLLTARKSPILEVSTVPLPAGGLLAVTAFAGAAALSRRRRLTRS